MAVDRMPWFKWWDGTAADMKFRMVAEECRLPVACIVGAWAYLLEHASRSVDRGSIDDVDFEVMAYTLGIPDCETVCNAMKRRKLVDETGRIVKWEDRQGKRERNEAPGASTERVRRMRAKQKAEQEAKENKDLPPGGDDDDDDGKGGNGVTPVTPRNATKRPKRKNREEEDKNPKTLTPSSAGADGEGDPVEPEPEAVKPFDQFWAAYPRRVAKAEAQKAWTKLKIDNDAPLQAIILNAIEKQKEGADWRKEDGQYIPHPATWLRAGRWLDEVRPYVAPAPKLPAGWWETKEGMEAAGRMLNPPLTPRPGEYPKEFAARIRQALGMDDVDPLKGYVAPPVPEKITPAYVPPAPPPGVQLTPEQQQARRDEFREAMAKLKQSAGEATAGIQAAAAA